MQPFVKAHIKENINAARHWPMWGEFTGHRWNPHKKTSNADNISIWWRHHDQCTAIILTLSVFEVYREDTGLYTSTT